MYTVNSFGAPEKSNETLPLKPQGSPPLWSHQKKALEVALKKFALFFDPGTGKSRTALELLKKENALATRVLIFAPLNVCRNWENEIGLYLTGERRVTVVAGQTKLKKMKALAEFNATHPGWEGTAFLIVNIESLRSREYIDLLKKSRAQFVIVDESHNFKTHSSLQTKGLIELLKWLDPHNIYLLSGTPAPQGEIDLWSTFYILGQTKDPFFVWRKKNFDDKNERRRGTDGYWPDYVIRTSARSYMKTLLKVCSLTARKNEVLDLPPLLKLKIYAELSAEQAKHYKTMREYLFAIDSEGNELNAANMLSRTMRLQQIVAGFLGDIPVKDNPRLSALDAAIEQTSGEPFIIWSVFVATYKQLAKVLDERGISFGFITGEQSAEERFKTMEDFQSGKLRALIANPRAGGVGVNLTAASYSIHYTRSFSLVDDLQCEARNYRGGSERHAKITRIDIIAADTLDEDISEALSAKKSVQDFILDIKGKYERHKD